MRKPAKALPARLAAAAFLTAAALSAQPVALRMDPAQTTVEFTLGDVLHTVHGAFALRRGDLRFDPLTGNAAGELVVEAASGASGSAARDSRMRKNVLEAGRYPEIVFRPDRVEGKVEPQGPSQVQLHGIFSIHGQDHEIAFPVAVEAAGGAYKATAHFVVPYVKWGMKNPSTLFLRVDDKVEITIRTVARP
jgi:polyisoprenoid-binding protein YceI